MSTVGLEDRFFNGDALRGSKLFFLSLALVVASVHKYIQ